MEDTAYNVTSCFLFISSELIVDSEAKILVDVIYLKKKKKKKKKKRSKYMVVAKDERIIQTSLRQNVIMKNKRDLKVLFTRFLKIFDGVSCALSSNSTL